MSVRCECGKIFKNKNSLKVHRSRICPIKTENRIAHSCPFCHKEYTRKGFCENHIRTCPQRPGNLAIDPEPIPSQVIQAIIPERYDRTSPAIPANVISSNQTRPITNCANNDNHINTTNNHNSHNTTNNNSNIVINNLHFDYNANISDKNMMKLFTSKFDQKYIKQGEYGLYEFVYWEVFTDPMNPKNTAIICPNHRDKRFIYGTVDEEGQTNIIEDYSLVGFNEYLSKYNKVIVKMINNCSPFSIGCLGYTHEVTNQRVENLINSMIERKNMKYYMANKIRAKELSALSKNELTDDVIDQYIEYYEDQNLTWYQNYIPSEEEKIEMAVYNSREAQRNPRREQYEKMKHKINDTITCWNEEKDCVEIKDEKEEFQKCVDEDNRKIQKDLAKAEEARKKEEEKERAREERERIRLETERFKRNEAIEKKKRLMERKKEREEQEKKDEEEEKKLAKMIDPNRPDSDDEEEKVIPKTKVKRERKYEKKSKKIVEKVEKHSNYKVKKLEIIDPIKETSDEDIQ